MSISASEAILGSRLALLVAVVVVAAGCGGSSGGGGPKIALLLPENETPRYETHDGPTSKEAVEELCEDCEVLYSNAGGDASKQQSQAEAALTQGAEVLVVDPMDAKSAAAIAEKAKAQNVPVRQLRPPDRKRRSRRLRLLRQRKVGELQAETLAKKLKEDGSASGPIIMINGDPADPNAALFKEGAHNGFDAAGVDDREGVRHARTGRAKTPSTRRSRRSPRSATTASPASTRPTTTPAAARSRR